MSADALKNADSGTVGVIEYRNVRVNALRQTTATIAPIYDESQRVIIASEVTINVHGIIYGEDAEIHSGRMLALQESLSKSGGRLIVSGIGLGVAIDSGETPDVNFGPKPQLHALRPLGANKAWEVIWSVVYRRDVVANGPGAFPDTTPVQASYDIEFSTNDIGRVTRTAAGFIEFFTPIKKNGNKLTVSAGAADRRFLSTTIIERPEWMRRRSARRRIDAAKNRIYFQIVDEEFEDGPFPLGMAHADAELSIENIPPGFINWSATLTATLTPAAGYPKSLAANRWFLMLFAAARDAKASVDTAKGVVIPERFRFSVPKFSRACRFSASWKMTACLHDILEKSGLWAPVPGTSFARWQASMNLAHRIEGAAGLSTDEQETLIYLGATYEKAIHVKPTGYRPSEDFPFSRKMLCPEVTEEQSYLTWENRIKGLQEQNATIHRPLQNVLPAIQGGAGVGSAVGGTFGGSTGGVVGGTVGGAVAGVAAYFATPQTGLQEDVVQYNGKTDNYVLMFGKSYRLKFAPEVPTLKKVMGVDVEEVARAVETTPVTAYFDCPLILGKWTILYRVKDQIYGVKPASNRHMCFTEGENDGHSAVPSKPGSKPGKPGPITG